MFAGSLVFLETEDCDIRFVLRSRGLDRLDLYQNDEVVVSGNGNSDFFDHIGTRVRLAVGEATIEKVLVHAGMVEWKGKGIMIPGTSMSGKTTLVKEFVAVGAGYLSDEYAVIDKEGRIHPFHKPLSIREKKGSFVQFDRTIEELGGKRFEKDVSASVILLTSFEEGGKWRPQRISRGSGMLQLLEHTLSIRNSPTLALKTLDEATKNAVFFVGKKRRGFRNSGRSPRYFGEIVFLVRLEELMIDSLKPEARTEGIVTQEMPDEVLVYDLVSNKAHCLNSTAGMIWKSCDGRSTTAEIRAVVEKETGKSVSDDVILLAVDQLRSTNLLVSNEVIEQSGLNRRELIKRAGLAAAIALPIVSSIAVPSNVMASASGLPAGSPCNSPIECTSGACTGAPGVCL